jgi:hypothetical protein
MSLFLNRAEYSYVVMFSYISLEVILIINGKLKFKPNLKQGLESKWNDNSIWQ